MGLSYRFFIYREDEIKKIPYAKYQRFFDGEAEFLEYAGETLNMAEIIVEVENKKVVGVIRSSFYLQKVTDEGTQDKEFEQDKMRHAINQMEPLDIDVFNDGIKKETPKTVIDASSRFEERRLDARCVWEPEYKVVRLIEEIAFSE